MTLGRTTAGLADDAGKQMSRLGTPRNLVLPKLSNIRLEAMRLCQRGNESRQWREQYRPMLIRQ